MPTWIEVHRGDILFVISLLAALALLTVGLLTGDTPTILLGAGALGIPGTTAAVRNGGSK